MTNTLQDRLLELRKSKGYTQSHVAELIGMSSVGYGYYENGTRQPSPETIVKLADVYRVTTDYLLGIENSTFTTEQKVVDTSLPELVNAVVSAMKEDNSEQQKKPSSPNEDYQSMEDIMEQLKQEDTLLFDGEILDEEDAQSIMLALNIAHEQIRQKREKRKNT